MKSTSLLSLLGLLLLASCGYLKEPGTPLAKVKDQTLTVEELKARGTTRRDSMMLRTKEWVNEQVLVQEALAKGLQNDKEVVWLLRDAERKILLDAFFRNFNASLVDPEEGELELYFENHKDQLVREEASVQIQRYEFTDIASAKKNMTDSTLLASAADTSLEWVPLSALGSCIEGIVATLKPGAMSIPQICMGKAVVIHLLARKPVGEPLSYAEARPLVLQSVREEHKQKKLDSLLAEAKSRQAVFTWPENLPSP